MNAGAVQRLRILSDGKVRVPDSGIFVAGSDNDLQISHNGTDAFIQNNTGTVKVRADAVNFEDKDSTIFYQRFIDGAGVKLYYAGTQRFETTSTGISVTGQIDIGTTSIYGTGDISMGDSDQLRLGGGDDLRIYHDGSINRIRSDVLTVIEKNDSEDMASFMPDGAVVLFHNGNQRFETTSTGASVTGNLNISGHTYLNDSRELVIGAGQDLKLYHNGSNNYIDNTSDFM